MLDRLEEVGFKADCGRSHVPASEIEVLATNVVVNPFRDAIETILKKEES